MGALILAFTPHSVYAAPYHRDNHGNRMIVDAFLAKPETAEQILRSAKADLLVWCQTGGKASPLAERAPAGLAAMLSRGAVPDWLEPVGEKEGPVHVFAVRPRD